MLQKGKKELEKLQRRATDETWAAEGRAQKSLVRGCSFENDCVPTCRTFFFLVLFTSSCFPVSLEKPKGQSDQPPFFFFSIKISFLFS